MSAAAKRITTGQVVDGKYRIGRQLGAGGMGAVYEATHLGTQRRVALKVIVSEALANEPGVVARFEREARASGAIDSAHVVQVLDTGVDPGTSFPYMVMEYLSGEDVADLVRRVGPLPPDLVARIGAQASLGLARAHEAGVVHRDIKSANLFLARRDGGEVLLKVLDFGIAKVRADPLQAGQDHGLTRTGSMLGSPLYMSPEQARGMKTLDGRSDVWSLGIVLFEALVGETPFHDKETLGDLLVAICVEPIPSIRERAPWIPAGLGEVIERALTRDPAARFASAREMHAALAALLPDGTSIRESMLGPLTAEMRARVAARVDRTVAMGPRPVTGSTPPLGVTPGGSVMARSDPGAAALGARHGSSPPPLGQLAAGGVTAGDLASTDRGARGGKTGIVALALVACVVGGGALAFAGRKTSRGDGPIQKDAPVGLVASAAAPAASSAAAPERRTEPTEEKSAQLAVVAPIGAVAEVDGRVAELRDGTLTIRGGPGSLHKVRLRSGEDEQDFDVTVLASGAAMPARIELVAKKKPSAVAAAGAKPAVPVIAKPAASAKPASGGEPAIKEQF